jgi:hypothetical protein
LVWPTWPGVKAWWTAPRSLFKQYKCINRCIKSCFSG